MKKYFIIIPKNQVTEEMESKLDNIIESNDNNYIMGMVYKDIPSLFNDYEVLTKKEYHQKMADEPELWVPESIRN